MTDLLDKLRAELAEAEWHPEWLAVDGGYIQDDSRGMLLRKLIAVVKKCETAIASVGIRRTNPSPGVAQYALAQEILKLIGETH